MSWGKTDEETLVSGSLLAGYKGGNLGRFLQLSPHFRFEHDLRIVGCSAASIILGTGR